MKPGHLIAIPSLDFASTKVLSFDLYVHLPNLQRTLLYRRKGAPIEADRIRLFQQENNVTFLIEKEAYPEYLKHVSERMKDLLGEAASSQVSTELAKASRSLLMSTVNTSTVEEAHQMMETLNDVSTVVVKELLQKSPPNQQKIFENFKKLAHAGTSFQKHPINLVTLSLLIATGLGHTNPEALRDLAIASLVHDLGLVRLSIKIIQFAHSPSQLGMSDRLLLHQHPRLTIDVLNSKEIYLSRRAQNIILQHHEEASGYGYPAGLVQDAIEPMAQVLLVADCLDHAINESKAVTVQQSVHNLVLQMKQNKVLVPGLQKQIEKLFGVEITPTATFSK